MTVRLSILGRPNSVSYTPLLQSKGLKYILKNAYHFINLRNRVQRWERFENFIYSRYHLSEVEYRSCEELYRNPPIYDYYICGSDQIWNPMAADYDLAYFLPFVKEGKRIAYAPSFGPKGNLIDIQKQKIKDLIHAFDHLSVRENEGAELLNDLVGRKVPVLVDPTLLMEAKDWDTILQPIDTPQNYIFFYTLFANRDMIKIVYRVSKALKLPVITPFVSNQFDIGTNFIKVTDCGPEQFLSYLKHATLVLTSSFHGTVFSILYEKPFYSINGMNDSRIRTLLTTTGLIQRSLELSEVKEKVSKCSDVDFGLSRQALSDERKKV